MSRILQWNLLSLKLYYSRNFYLMVIRLFRLFISSCLILVFFRELVQVVEFMSVKMFTLFSHIIILMVIYSISFVYMFILNFINCYWFYFSICFLLLFLCFSFLVFLWIIWTIFKITSLFIYSVFECNSLDHFCAGCFVSHDIYMTYDSLWYQHFTTLNEV